LDLEIPDVAMRLTSAALAGVVIGINRDYAQKPIGMRTLGLVSLGAATITVAAIQVPGMTENADAMSRVVQGVIQGVMAGISFIGAGVILRDHHARTVDGLTTAASVWVTAALGVACGLGMWGVVVIAAAIGLILLVALGWLEVGQKVSNKHPDQRSDGAAGGD
jgi:putative Mg2+ transporter-C (MgtC) family protein